MSQTVVKLEMLVPKAGYQFLQEFAKEQSMPVSNAAAVLLQAGYEFYMHTLQQTSAELAEARRIQHEAAQTLATAEASVPASVTAAVSALNLDLGKEEVK